MSRFKYSVGPWNVHEGADSYGPAVRESISMEEKFKMFKETTKLDIRKLIVYVLCNYNTTFEQDLERIYTLRELGYWAYVMLYDKENIPFVVCY